MRSRVAIGALAVLVSLSLTGCFGLPSVDDAVDTATDIADAATDLADRATTAAEDLADRATEIADELSGIEWDKTERVVVRNAASGEVITEVADPSAIESALSPLARQNGIASVPDTPAEYVFEVWQNKTVQLGEPSSDTEEVQALSLTTYEDSEVVTIAIPIVNLSLSLSSPDTASALRQIVE